MQVGLALMMDFLIDIKENKGGLTMNAEKYMLPKEKLTILDLDENVGSALDKIIGGNFLSLPVMDGNEFKGFLMKETIYRKYFDYEDKTKKDYLENVKVKDIYTDDYKSIRAKDLVEEASYLLKEFRTPFLPVFNDRDEFIGILTHSAIFNAFSQIVGLGRGTRLVVDVYDIPGQLATLAGVIRKANVNILNFTALDTKVLDVYKAILRVDTKDEETLRKLIQKIEAAGFKIGNIN